MNLTATISSVGARERATERVSCTHCGLEVPPGLIRGENRGPQFCCHGCETAYSVIHACGLDRYYHLVKESGDRRATRTTDRRYAEYDDGAFQNQYVRARESSGARTAETELLVENVHCTACLWLLERLPRVVEGVVEARVDLRRRAVRISWDPERVKLSRIARALDSLGYPPHPARGGSGREARAREDRRYLIRLGIAGACAGNVMLLAFALYAGLFQGIEPAYARVFSWLSLGFTVVSLAWPGRVFFTGAWAAIRTRTIHLDLPIAIGLGTGAIWSAYITVVDPLGSRVAGSGGIYYDSLAMLVFALLIGRFIQHRQQRWAADNLELLFCVSPTSARLVEGDSSREVAIDAVVPGQMVEVLAGECFPVDGVVACGTSEVDEAVLTGESRPVLVKPGSVVAAGATNLVATLRIRVDATGVHTRVGRLMMLVEECSRRRAPIVQLADRLAGWFIVSMMVLAAGTIIAWWSTSPSLAIQHAVALLIVTCPCGLGLATPLAMTVALGRAARRALLIKGADAVQALGEPGVIFLDKTGTLTQATPTIAEWRGETAIRPLVDQLEATSTHPIARAFAPLDPSVRSNDAQTRVGGGVRGVVQGHDVVAGSAAFLAASGIEVDHPTAAALASIADRGLTPVLMARDGVCIALAGIGDQLRPEAPTAVASLQRQGWDVRLLSGDHPGAVAAIARTLGLRHEAAIGGASPARKLEIVQQARAADPARSVVMIGDGVNDSAALAAATVGVAVHGGAEAALVAADVSITKPGLEPVMELLRGARTTMAAIRFNLAVSIAYNVLAAALCVTGVVTPLMAAILMPASSLTVLALSFRAWGRGDATTPRRAACPSST